ncbi:uncharacterized protein Hap1MRO34_013198 [Clarias gariepinus]|uniref:uncharacterized protein LOC128533303 n=1 Tax=Clarias gariepinus TaxID=13013 RepID=UPI00234DEFDF|nr:uncharacterized protein LOC128533303 [Clarias gariepinus]
MKTLLLLDIILYGILFPNTWAWSVHMPHSVYGLDKSCLVIQCTFSYSSYPPQDPYRIVWYQYVSSGYPLVFDNRSPNSVIERYRGRTSLYNRTYRDCSLLIENLSPSHHGDRIYTWIDPENVGWRTYKFYDVTTLIHVQSSAPKPSVATSGGCKIGESITVRCKTYHTCPTNPPFLSLSGIEKNIGTEDKLEKRPLDDGKWEITLIREGVVESETQEIECSVTHSGGLSASTNKTHNAKCDFQKPVISPTHDLAIEGIEKSFTCTVNHTCKKQKPNIIWNYRNMPVSVETQKGSNHSCETISTLKLKASQDDHGKILTCTSQTTDGEMSEHITLKVKKEENFFYVIIPVAAVLGTISLFGAACYFVIKKYKIQIQELESRSPNRVLSRLSRMSRR